ncbi:hypothetical protein KP509_15G059600 [Ceratopteris richardii]|uniref:DRBM domain-containing protein n=1 Tax=Ceratopteris richardii TaxID=49495 RepID=A0A8T2T3V9_CERRI|nr:hypothetical protein KP509_15G059600 [Ceratopteris richardii]KAH7405172.1 hypothetical protein KP509_15G059600 [Ceratopteris richardii]KAH7405173.1 hypothetical protein KP509_15G059600 [Ceratopteris richardii]
MFKSQLQEFAQKGGWTAPVYDVTKEGPSHQPRYKAVVTVNDESFESPGVYGNLKKAEHAAAEVALKELVSRSETKAPSLNPLHESGLCKNLLQEYAQKSQLPIPLYTLTKSGPTHSPLFTASVKIDGVLYKGGLSKNRKEAEIKAAKTALLAICADKGGTPEQVFHNQLASIGQEEAPVFVADPPPRSGTKRKRRRFYRAWPRRGRTRRQGTDEPGHPTVKRKTEGHQGSEVPEHSAGLLERVPAPTTIKSGGHQDSEVVEHNAGCLKTL